MKKVVYLFTSILAIGASMVLSGCGKTDQNVLKAKPDEGSDRGRKLVVFNWDDYCAPELIEAFELETGIEVTIETYQSLGEMTGRMQSDPDAFDLVVVDEVTLNELREVKLVQKLDHSKIFNLKNILPEYLDLQSDPHNEYSVPYLWGTTLVAYRTDKIEDPDESWNLLWDPALQGKVAMMEEKEDLYAASLLSLGYRLNSEDPKILDEALEHLKEQRKLVQPVYLPLGDVEDLLVSGNVWATVLYSGDAAMLAEEDDRIGYFIPKEGAPVWMDNFAIAREAKNIEEAHLFIDFMLRGEVAAANSEYLWSATPNQKAIEFLSEDLRQDTTVYPSKSTLAKCDFHAQPSLDRLESINQGMSQLFQQARTEIVLSQDLLDSDVAGDSQD